ncbi:MAG: HeH/LEM domain-containing protein [Achromobacter sp.]|uniref:HeH/LEM domain-containing protein n=1 Tax=Achromobacter sp. TaxID=134375 RepID=UPI003D015A63
MKAKTQPRRVLLFVAASPSVEDKAMARRAGVLIRDPRAYRPGDFIERCNAVAGDVPPAYRERYLVLSQDDLGEILRPFAPVKLGDPAAPEEQADGQENKSDGHATTGESSRQQPIPPLEPPPAPPPEPHSGEGVAVDDSKATIDGLKAALDAKAIPYPKTAKKAELQALLAAET